MPGVLAGALAAAFTAQLAEPNGRVPAMNNIIYIVGLVVVVIAVLSFFGLR